MEYPRPSPNFGKLISTRVTPSSDTAPGSSAGSRRTTLSLGDGELSLTTRRPLMSVAIDAFLERFNADAVHYVDEALGFAVAMLEVAVDQALDDPRYVRARERRTNDPAQRRAYFTDARFTLITADLDLVPLLAVLVDAEDADMADVVMAAGVHAARDVEVELADLVQVIQVVEALLDRLRDRNRLRVRQRAEIAARAADDVGEQADVGGRQSESARLAPKLDQVALTH